MRAMMKNLVSRCPIEEVMQLLSGRWPTLLLYYLSDGTKRFSDLRRDNPTISHKMLTLELRKLEDAGIVRRHEFDGDRKSVVEGKIVSVRVDIGGCGILKKKNLR